MSEENKQCENCNKYEYCGLRKDKEYCYEYDEKETKMNNELIVLEQLPVIRAKLENISKDIKEKVDRATSLIVNEETVKEVKQVRANLTKEFNELEEQRKKVKNAIMQKYDEFNDIYVANVSNLYKNADAELKEKIDNVENQLKKEKEDELREFAQNWFVSKGIESFVKFEDIGLKINVTSTMKSLKEQIIAFCEKVFNDIQLIDMENYKEEILLEYQKTLDFANSKMLVVERHKKLEEKQKQQELKQEQEKQEEKVVEKVEEITIPKEVIEEDELLKVTFTIETTKQNIIELKKWLNERGIKYGNNND